MINPAAELARKSNEAQRAKYGDDYAAEMRRRVNVRHKRNLTNKAKKRR